MDIHISVLMMSDAETNQYSFEGSVTYHGCFLLANKYIKHSCFRHYQTLQLEKIMSIDYPPTKGKQNTQLTE